MSPITGNVLPYVAIREAPRSWSNRYGSLGDSCWQEEQQEDEVVEDNDDVKKMLPQPTGRTYVSRFWILFVSSYMCWLHVRVLGWSTACFEVFNVHVMNQFGEDIFIICTVFICWFIEYVIQYNN